MDHFLLLVWHALLISVFFTFLWKKPEQRRRFFVLCFLALAGGALALGWLMYPFP